jgi:hypothetical protein
MKANAPESRGKNTPKPSVKQGQNPSQLGQNEDENIRHPEFVKPLLFCANLLVDAIASNYALTHLIQDGINIQYYEGEKNSQSEHGQKMCRGIQVLFDRSNLALEQASDLLREVIVGKRVIFISSQEGGKP